MNEEQNDQRTINAGTNIRLPIGLLASFVVAVAVYFFAQDWTLRESIHQLREDMEKRLDAKANITQTKDRYTSRDATKDGKAYTLSDKALQRELMMHMEESNRIHKHIHDDVSSHTHQHSEIIHEKAH